MIGGEASNAQPVTHHIDIARSEIRESSISSPSHIYAQELFARDPETLEREWGLPHYEKIKDHTPEGWAKDFEAAIAKIVERARP